MTPEVIRDTIFLGTSDTICLDTFELKGDVSLFENFCEDDAGEYVLYELVIGAYCITYEGIDLGTDSACLVICDDLGICDTTHIYVTVIDIEPEEELPIAVEDYDTTSANSPVVINVLNNDTLNGILDTIYIVEDATFGNLLIDSDGSIIYDPGEDYCNDDEPDSFQYAICNENGCDTTTVFIYIPCDEILIYTGVSPNGDGFNDVFYIQGVEQYPNNKLMIFNRWGNLVYEARGYLNTWNGEYKNKALPDGTYFYIFEDG